MGEEGVYTEGGHPKHSSLYGMKRASGSTPQGDNYFEEREYLDKKKEGPVFFQWSSGRNEHSHQICLSGEGGEKTLFVNKQKRGKRGKTGRAHVLASREGCDAQFFEKKERR